MKLYFIAIQTPESITQEIRDFQHIFESNYDAKRQLRIPVHLTLVPPFKTDDTGIALVKNALHELSTSWKRFPIDVNGFGHFRKDVIYASVRKSPNLLNIRNQIIDKLSSSELNLPELHEFTPHITLANKDLAREQFKSAWAEFSLKSYTRSFNFEGVVIYEHDGEAWQISSLIELRA